MDPKNVLASGFVLCALLTACGGGGGGGGTTPATATPIQTPTTPPTSTNASGQVVDDASGSALAGVNVSLEPWTAGATPLPAPVATTDSNGNFTLTNAPNGHYLLIIGSNSATDTTRATVHDNVTLQGGNQTLSAPTLPTVHAYTPPAWETNGKYRLAQPDATTEVPCFTRFNSDRAGVTQPAVPLDEWSLENSRANVADQLSSQVQAGAYISTQHTQAASGVGSSCNIMVDFSFPPNSNAYANDPRVAWFGGKYNASGTMEAPFDPRGYTDPNYPNWP